MHIIVVCVVIMVMASLVILQRQARNLRHKDGCCAIANRRAPWRLAIMAAEHPLRAYRAAQHRCEKTKKTPKTAADALSSTSPVCAAFWMDNGTPGRGSKNRSQLSLVPPTAHPVVARYIEAIRGTTP